MILSKANTGKNQCLLHSKDVGGSFMKRKAMLVGVVFVCLLSGQLYGCGSEDVSEGNKDSMIVAEEEVSGKEEEDNADTEAIENISDIEEKLNDEEDKEELLLEKEIVYSDDGSVYQIYEYSYDSQGNQISVTCYSSDGDICDICEMEYDGWGRLSKQSEYKNNGQDLFTYRELIYDNDGNLLQVNNYNVRDNNSYFAYKYFYDSQNRLVREEHPADNGLYLWFEYAYDEQGNLSKEAMCYDDPDSSSYCRLTEYIYNEKGLLLKQIEYDKVNNVSHLNDVEDKDCNIEYWNEYTYDDNDNLIEYIRYPNNLRHEFIYASAGKLGVREKEDEKNSIISSYSVVRDDFSRSTEDDRQIEMYFDKVVFEGSDDIIYWLNGQVESMESTYRKEQEEYIEDDLENLRNDPYSSGYSFSPRGLDSVYYDDKYVSIGWSGEWYAGGVADVNYECMNYDLNTKSELTLFDILGEKAYDIVADALVKEDNTGSLNEFFEYNMLNTIPFYFDEDTVYINFPDYELGVSWSVCISVPRIVE